MISGEMRVGQSVKVQCSIDHTCSNEPPTLDLNIPLRHPTRETFSMADGTSKTILTTQLDLVKDLQTVECSVSHTEGQKAQSSQTLNATCR